MNHRNFLEYSKTFLGVLSLLVILSCSTAVQENTAQSDIIFSSVASTDKTFNA